MTDKHYDIEMIQERDVPVRMRDGIHLSVDVYRPSAAGRYPVLFASALHNKDIQGPENFRSPSATTRIRSAVVRSSRSW